MEVSSTLNLPLQFSTRNRCLAWTTFIHFLLIYPKITVWLIKNWTSLKKVRGLNRSLNLPSPLQNLEKSPFTIENMSPFLWEKQERRLALCYYLKFHAHAIIRQTIILHDRLLCLHSYRYSKWFILINFSPLSSLLDFPFPSVKFW